MNSQVSSVFKGVSTLIGKIGSFPGAIAPDRKDLFAFLFLGTIA